LGLPKTFANSKFKYDVMTGLKPTTGVQRLCSKRHVVAKQILCFYQSPFTLRGLNIGSQGCSTAGTAIDLKGKAQIAIVLR